MSLTDDQIETYKKLFAVVEAIDEAHVCIEAAVLFGNYLMHDRNEEKRHQLEAGLSIAKEWIDEAIKDLALLKKELDK